MKRKIAMLFLIPVCFYAFTGGVFQTEADADVIAPTEEPATVSAYKLNPAVPETIPETEPPVPETTVPETTVPEPQPVEEFYEEEHTDYEPEAEDYAYVETDDDSTDEACEVYDGVRSLGTFTLTAYCSCVQCCGDYAIGRPVDENGREIVYGATGVRLEPGVSIAVDPYVIPYGAQVVINGNTYVAHDTGGNIVGNRIDVFFDDHNAAWDFGTQYAEVFVEE